MFTFFNGVARNPEWVVRCSWHAKGSHIPLICVVEGAHVVRHIKAELVILVKEYIVDGH